MKETNLCGQGLDKVGRKIQDTKRRKVTKTTRELLNLVQGQVEFFERTHLRDGFRELFDLVVRKVAFHTLCESSNIGANVFYLVVGGYEPFDLGHAVNVVGNAANAFVRDIELSERWVQQSFLVQVLCETLTHVRRLRVPVKITINGLLCSVSFV